MKALPNWERWLQRDSVSLSEAAALSINLSPEWVRTVTEPPAALPTQDEYAAALSALLSPQADPQPPVPQAVGRISWAHPAHTNEEGRARLGVLRECFDTGSPLLPPVATVAKPGHRPERRVRLADVARFALSQGWEIPVPLAALSPAAHAGPERPENLPPPPADTMLKKSVLIRRVLHEWPTVKEDMSEATRPTGGNGLRVAMADGHGMWWLEAARTWARSRGKLSTAAALPSSIWAVQVPPKAKRRAK